MSFKLAPEGFTLRDLDPWGVLYEAKEIGSMLQAKVVRLRHVDGQGETWEVEFTESPGVTGLIPSAETGLPIKCPMKAFVGKPIVVKIKSIDKANSLVACSRRESVEIALNRLINQLNENEVISSMVRLVTEYNVYLDLGGGVIVSISREKAQMSSGIPLDIQYQVGAVIRVRVAKLDKENKKIKVEPIDPWEIWGFERGEIISGQIVANRDLMVYAMVKPALVGLVSCKPYEYFSEGEAVEFQVISFDRAQRKLHLTVWDPKRAVERKKEINRNRKARLAAREVAKLSGKEVQDNVISPVFVGENKQG